MCHSGQRTFASEQHLFEPEAVATAETENDQNVDIGEVP